MLKDKRGETIYDYITRFCLPHFRDAVDRKLIQHAIKHNHWSTPNLGTRSMSILFLELCSVYLAWLRCFFACYLICLSAYCFVKKERVVAGLVMFSLAMMCSMWLLQEEQVLKVKAGPDS